MGLDDVLGIMCSHLAFDFVALMKLPLDSRAKPEHPGLLWGDSRIAA